jgi:hypothetical protein
MQLRTRLTAALHFARRMAPPANKSRLVVKCASRLRALSSAQRVRPECTSRNLRGRGFMTIQLADGRKTFTDLRETAPLAATAAWLLFHQQAVAARARPDPERALRAEW